MKSRIEQDATEEIVRDLKPKILRELQTEIAARTHLSIYTVAGMLDVSPATAMRIFDGKIITIGPRQQRISVKDFDEVILTYTPKQKPRDGEVTKSGIQL